MKKLLNIGYIILITALLFVSGSVVLSKLDVPYISYRVFNVSSGSMDPAVPKNSLVFVAPQENYEKEDVITFSEDRDINRTVTHRIVKVSRDEDLGTTSYVTKGDANEDVDSGTVSKENVLGEVILTLPYLGIPIAFAKTQMGFVLLIVIPATLIVYSELLNIKKELGDWWGSRSNKKEKEEEEEE